jgi:hypothetical protein
MYNLKKHGSFSAEKSLCGWKLWLQLSKKPQAFSAEKGTIFKRLIAVTTRLSSLNIWGPFSYKKLIK